MCLKAEDFKKSVSFAGDDERVIRYLKGETLDLSGTEAENEKAGYWSAWTVTGLAGAKRPAVP